MRFSTIVAIISFTFLSSTQAAPAPHNLAQRGVAALGTPADDPAPPWRRDPPTTDWRRSAESTHSDAPPWKRDAPTTDWRRAPKTTDTDAPPWKRDTATEEWKHGTDGEQGYPSNDWKRRADSAVESASGSPTDWRRGEDTVDGYPSQGWKRSE